jgi:pseudouridine kinase
MKSKNTEQLVFQAIRDNPYATQNEIGQALGIARPTVAFHIERLQNKGMILGRAYVLNKNSGIACIGAMAVDQIFQLDDPVVLDTSNLTTRAYSCGGVARNVAENLARLHVKAHLLSQVGDDTEGKWLIEQTRKTSICTNAISINTQYPTAIYTAIIEPDGSLHMGISDMQIFNEMHSSFIHKQWKHIAGSKLVFCDTNGSRDLIKTIIERSNEQDLPLYMDAVSTKKAIRLPQSLKGIHGLFCNILEAQAILSMNTDKPEILVQALLERGAKKIFLTHGKHGVWIAQQDGISHIPAPTCPVVNVSGAGDALIAGTLYGIYNDYKLEDAVTTGIKAAQITLQDVAANSIKINTIISSDISE